VNQQDTAFIELIDPFTELSYFHAVS